MSNQHPIIPPPELVEQWFLEARAMPVNQWVMDIATQAARWGADQELVEEWVADIWHEGTFVQVAADNLHIATQAAQWGADQELEACCKWTAIVGGAEALRAARRPKPPSLKEQALARTDAILNDPSRALLVEVRETLELNRRALEALPND